MPSAGWGPLSQARGRQDDGEGWLLSSMGSGWHRPHPTHKDLVPPLPGEGPEAQGETACLKSPLGEIEVVIPANCFKLRNPGSLVVRPLGPGGGWGG